LSEEFTDNGIWWFRRIGNGNGDYRPRRNYREGSWRRRRSVRLVVFVMEREVPDYRFLTGRARNKERISWRFSRYYPIVPVLARLIVAVGPPVSVLVWCEKSVVVTLFVGSVKVCSIGTQKQLRQFETK
jgi:hypothetical protein